MINRNFDINKKDVYYQNYINLYFGEIIVKMRAF